MTVNLYNYYGKKNVVDKNLPKAKERPCELVNTDILFPVLKLDKYNLGTEGYNYCYIPEFSRYYFITGLEAIPGGHMLVSCKVDVLMSYAIDIKANPQMVHRCEDKNLWNKDKVDNLLPLKNKKEVTGYNFSTAVFSESDIFAYYILGVK